MKHSIVKMVKVVLAIHYLEEEPDSPSLSDSVSFLVSLFA